MKRAILYGFISVILLLSSACGYRAREGTYVWIDVPVNNLVLPDPQSVKIEGHAASPGGISRVDVFIDGALLTSIPIPSGSDDLAEFRTIWAATTGTHAIQAVAYGSTGTTSESDTVSINIGGVGSTISVTPEITVSPSVTPEIPVTPTITLTPTPTARPEPVIQFWADPVSIEAGKCTNIRWNVSNVSRIVFGGVEQPFSGSDSECPCAGRSYTLTVTLLDGTTVERYANVEVSGSCATPVPPDTIPPPVPLPQVPADGLSIACKASQSLTWLPVTDPSKIKEYQVRIQKSSDNSHWTDISTSPITGLTDKTTTIGVECGWYYRWSVRAIDGAGNISGWSGWSDFVVNLS